MTISSSRALRLATLVAASFCGFFLLGYGGIYICSSLLWLWWVEGVRPDLWDLTGACLSLVGAGIILFAPRGA